MQNPPEEGHSKHETLITPDQSSCQKLNSLIHINVVQSTGDLKKQPKVALWQPISWLLIKAEQPWHEGVKNVNFYLQIGRHSHSTTQLDLVSTTLREVLALFKFLFCTFQIYFIQGIFGHSCTDGKADSPTTCSLVAYELVTEEAWSESGTHICSLVLHWPLLLLQLLFGHHHFQMVGPRLSRDVLQGVVFSWLCIIWWNRVND